MLSPKREIGEGDLKSFLWEDVVLISY